MTSRTQFESDVFTCTFCFRLSTQKPRVLGRSARLTCTECYKTIINLSICWTCGEMILRDSDCVSFGWCFWHRVCYGCLFYGSRKLFTGVLNSRGKPFGMDGISGVGEENSQEEILQAPLCMLCAVECEVDGLDEYGILQRGLKRIDLVDGGVTRRRWVEKAGLRLGQCRPSIANNQEGRIEIEQAKIKEMRDAPMFWVHIDDPVNGTSFRPHPLKPFPDCMQHFGKEDDGTRFSQQSNTISTGLGRQQGTFCLSERAQRKESHSEPCLNVCS